MLKQLRERLVRMKPSASSQGKTEHPALCRGGGGVATTEMGPPAPAQPSGDCSPR